MDVLFVGKQLYEDAEMPFVLSFENYIVCSDKVYCA